MSIDKIKGRELDVKMAELMGWIYWDFDFRDYDGKYPMFTTMDSLLLVYDKANKHREFSPSTDIAAAMQVAEKMRRRGIHINIISQEDGYLITASEFQPQLNCYFNIADLRVDSFEKLPEAICQVIIVAVEAE